ncbi:MAG: LamG-like jellyroll fold domain-containing protein [Planctomycetia bacterium]|nr:LamG-like jellyroll fold domain-containing protein [Planctomycetia bacterium]
MKTKYHHKTLFLLLTTFLCCGSFLQAESPLSSADRVWQFASENDGGGTLLPHGKVELGVPLSGKEQEESVLRGGDGHVARFASASYLSFESAPALPLLPDSDSRTICVRFRSDAPRDHYPLVSRHGGHERLAWNFFFYDGSWGCELGTTDNEKVLTTRAPLHETRTPNSAATEWHDLIARITPAKLELFLDGRCVDEDFVLGQLRAPTVALLFGAQYSTPNNIESGFSGDLDYVAMWNRALSKEEITQLSGGVDRVDSRALTDRGNGESLQYWLPANRFEVADCMPFSHNGVFHFMYLLDNPHGTSHGCKNGFGAHQWVQATSTDLVHWQHQSEFVVPIDEQNEGSICTGSMFIHNNTYYAFYANRAMNFTMPDGSNRSPFGLICVSTSSDGIHFTKSQENPLFYLPDEFSWGTRDPVVVTDPKSGRHYMYVTTNLYGRGCLVRLVSDDLFHWTLEEPVYALRDGDPECADVFQWGENWYLIVGHTNGYYRMANSPLGPWERPSANDTIMPGIVNVPKTAPWKNNRRIVCAWSREHGFGGHAVFHELVLRNDGTLGEKFVPEMIPLTAAPCAKEENISDVERLWEHLPGNLRLQARLTFDPALRDALIGCQWTLSEGKVLTIDPGRRRIQIGDFALENVDFSSGHIDLDLIIQADLVDLCINNDRAVIDTLPEMRERTISLRQNEPDRFRLESLTIAPLVCQP